MKNLIQYILFIILSYSIAYTQVIPNKYILNKEISLSKINADENPIGNSVTDIITVGDTIWVGTGSGLSVSFNNGVTWKSFRGTSEFGTEDISALAYNNGVLWVATAHSENINNEDVDIGTGLKYTFDNGLTWHSVPQPIDTQSDTTINYGINVLNALPITVEEKNLTFDIAFTQGTVWITSFTGGLRKSSNYGATWERVVIPPDYLDAINPTDTLSFCLSVQAGNFCPETNLNHRAFSVISTNDSTLYVGTAGGINKSTDGGVSWEKFNHNNQTNSISGNFVVALAYNKSNKTLWAATWAATGAGEFYSVSLSTDGGNNWSNYLNGEKAHNFEFKLDDVIALSDKGAFRSSNLGLSWITPQNIKDQQTNLSLTTNVFFSASVNNDKIWLGSKDGLARLTESNAVWEGTWKIFFASQPLTTPAESYAFPNPFSPRISKLKIKYSTGGKSVPVTIRIFDFGMNYVSTVIQNATRGNPLHSVDKTGIIDFWDGKDANGNIVPNGVYFYRIEAGGNVQYGKIVVIQ